MPKTEMKSDMVDTIKTWGDTVTGYGKNAWFAGLGVVATFDENTRSTFNRLVDKGQHYTEGEGVIGRTVGQATDKAKELGQMMVDGVQQTTSGVLNRVGVPTNEEIRTLIDRVEKLTRKVDALAK